MDSSENTADAVMWYIGVHENRPRLHHSPGDALMEAQDAGYNMVTIPITTPSFQSQTHALLSEYRSAVESARFPDEIPFPLVPPLTPSDTPLYPHDTIAQCLAMTSPWIDLASSDPVVANVSRQVFNLEVAYAAFCGVQNVVVRGPIPTKKGVDNGGIAQFSRTISEALSVGPYLHFSIWLPLGVDFADAVASADDLSSQARTTPASANRGSARDPWRAWEVWNMIRTTCKYNNRVTVALELSRHLPPSAVQSRWFSEPLRLLSIPNAAFLVNKFGQPVLSKNHKALISRYMRLRTVPWILLSVGTSSQSSAASSAGNASESQAEPNFPTPAEAFSSVPSKTVKDDPTPHLSYLRYLQRSQPAKSTIERFGTGYQDFLQAPLQPLADNLESITYEVFEKDPIKYDWYERAVMHALRDWIAEEKPVSSSTGAVVVAVVGAGRGPLVTRAIRAAKLAQVEIDIWAVEKNPNAYVFLQHNNDTIWDGKVTVVKSDMRAWKGPHRDDGTFGKVDIIVSELLGSFADNELSPECIDGVQHVLNEQVGISIPASYTAHLTPIASPRLYADVLGRFISDPTAFEVPYVVMLHAFDFLSLNSTSQHENEDWKNLSGEATPSTPASNDSTELEPDVKLCWDFKHPQPPAILAQAALRAGSGATGGSGGATGGDGSNEHNTRFVSLTFKCASRGVCHGLAGYFETVLYQGGDAQSPSISVELSTNPVTMEEKSKDMISWFPIFFPLKTPISFPDNTELDISMWRMTDDRKVWYEWVVESFLVTGHGRRVRLGVTDLHTSKKNGCLM